MRLCIEDLTYEIEKQNSKWASIDLEAEFLYWDEFRKKATSRKRRKLAEQKIQEILKENQCLAAKRRFEELLQLNKIERKEEDQIKTEDLDQAILEYRLWGRVPLWLKTVISCSAVGIFYSIAVGYLHSSPYRYYPISNWPHYIPEEAIGVLQKVQGLSEVEALGIFQLAREETDPILAAKVGGQWYSLYQWA